MSCENFDQASVEIKMRQKLIENGINAILNDEVKNFQQVLKASESNEYELFAEYIQFGEPKLIEKTAGKRLRRQGPARETHDEGCIQQNPLLVP